MCVYVCVMLPSVSSEAGGGWVVGRETFECLVPMRVTTPHSLGPPDVARDLR